MPKGRPKKSPISAKEESERLILEELRKWPDGLRLIDLTNALKSLPRKVHKNTIIYRLQELMRKNIVSYNRELKRYQITNTDISFETLRRLEIMDILRDSKQLVHITYVGSDFGFPDTFVKGEKRPRIHELPYHKMFEKKGQEFPDKFIKDILNLAKEESLIDADFFKGKKSFDDLSNEVLEKIWQRLFNTPLKILHVETIDTEKLLDFFKSPLGKARMNYVITGDEAEEHRYINLYHDQFERRLKS